MGGTRAANGQPWGCRVTLGEEACELAGRLQGKLVVVDRSDARLGLAQTTLLSDEDIAAFDRLMEITSINTERAAARRAERGQR